MAKNVKAVFDFDNTITTKDTLFHFIRFYHGELKFLWGIFVLSPMLFLFVCKLISNEKAKQRMFSFYFKGEKSEVFREKCIAYSKEIDKILNSQAIERIEWHNGQGHEVIIVSASIEDWIKPWAEQHNITLVIGTKLESKNSVLTGSFASPNCYGAEKVKRFLEFYPDRDDYELFAYGDSRGDAEMLELSDHPFYKTFE